MKKVLLFLGVWLIGINSAVAEIYHGIDIDEVFATSDWNSKDEIKDIIDDYTLILKYNKDLTECRNTYKIDCLNELTKKIMAHFYSFNYETNLKNYNNFNINEVKKFFRILFDTFVASLRYAEN